MAGTPIPASFILLYLITGSETEGGVKSWFKVVTFLERSGAF